MVLEVKKEGFMAEFNVKSVQKGAVGEDGTGSGLWQRSQVEIVGRI